MSYTYLTMIQREVICKLLANGHSKAEIAVELGVHKSTIYRELNKNSRASGDYSPSTAQHKSQQRRKHAKQPWKLLSQPLKEYVLDKLHQHWSPEQIAGRLQLEFPEDESLRISHETIYKWVYALKREGSDLYKTLRFSHKKRRSRRDAKKLRGQIADRRLIHERPAEVEEKVVIGHWEGDTVEGQKGSGYLVTLVERVSSYTIAAHIPTKEAESLNDAAITSFKALPPEIQKTLTVDNGKEFSRHQELERATNMQVYFADPYSSWQRGLNENTNGLLRHYFPKGTDFRKLTQSHIQHALKQLNHRPRKKLNFLTPHEFLMQHIVALQT